MATKSGDDFKITYSWLMLKGIPTNYLKECDYYVN